MIPASAAHLALASCVWLAVLLAACRVSADPVASEALIQEGIALRREGKDAEALERFRRAHEAEPSARALAQIGLAEQALGRWVDAEKHLDEALASDDPWIRERRAVLADALEQIRANVGSLEAVIDAPEPQISIDGVVVASSRFASVRLAAGAHDVMVRAPGFRPVTRSVEIRAGVISRERFTLERLEAPQPATRSSGPARQAGPDSAPRPAPAGAASKRRAAAWIALAAAGALLAGAVTANVIRERNVLIYNDDSRCLQGTLSRTERCGDHLGTAQTAQTLAIVGYSAAAAMFGLSIGLFTFDAGEPARSGRRGSEATFSWSASW